MKRLIDLHLKSWKNSEKRKPLLLKGARQVGKTHAVRQLGKQFGAFVELNFELLPEAKAIFEKDLMPERIIREVGLLAKEEISPGKTLLFFDEVQAAPQVIQALRYFYERMPDLHVIAAGSLLDFAIEKVGIPVGRVNTLYVYPLSFMEFLAAIGESQYIQPVLEGEVFSEALHSRLLGFVQQYLAIGGMPEVVSAWAFSKEAAKSLDVQKELVETYTQDFPKYAKKHQIPYVEILFRQIPHLIGESFKYSAVHGEFKKRELAPCLDLLRRANVVHQITHSSGNGIPLGAEANLDQFKLIFLDVGLSQAILGLNMAEWFLNLEKTLVNRGKVVEAFVGQELLCYAAPKWKTELYFWKREAKGSLAEVDYLCDRKGTVIPIEVKSGHGSTLRSLHQFLETHPQSTEGIRFWAKNYSLFEAVESLPLYAVAVLASEEQRDAFLSLLP
ncbi:MAG: ATP-binding protein [Chlamydiota bacterium]